MIRYNTDCPYCHDIFDQYCNLFKGYKNCDKSDCEVLKILKENEQLKENGVVWHDLKKNPSDLPQKVGDYIVALDYQTETFNTSLLEYNVDEDEDYIKLCWFDSEYTKYDNVIAWCELPRFKKELAE